MNARSNSPFLVCLVFILLTSLSFRIANNLQPPDEICDNGLDDDADGLIDLNDPDCECPVIEPESLIPNPSFEDMNCCPTDRSLLNCAEGWIQASEATTDFLHTCGWMGWPDFPPPLPFPNGNGAVGFRDGRVIQNNPQPGWKEYAGACLLSPLKANTKYRFEFYVGFVDRRKSPPLEITFFGTTDCSYLPFGTDDSFFGCPTNGPGWVFLGSTGAGGVGWVQYDIEVTPTEDIYAIAIGPDCLPSLSDISVYYFFDNLVLAEQSAFEFRITGNEHPCSDNFNLQVPQNPDFEYQWYLDGIALPGETHTELNTIYGEGDYQVRILGDNQCNVTPVFKYQVPSFSETVTASVCEGENYLFGDLLLDQSGSYTDTFKTANNCDSVVNLTLNVQGSEASNLDAKIFEGEKVRVGEKDFRLPGDYEILLISSNGCDSLVQLHLEYYKVFFPNIFSPNQDGVNDTFNVFASDDVAEVKRLQIYNRWGGLAFDEESMLPNGTDGWDGTNKGKVLDNGVYVFLTTLLMDDGDERSFSGSVMLLR